MISWKVTQLNKIHRWTPEKEGGRVDGGWGKGVGEGEQREGKGMEERRESYTTCDYSTQNYEGKTHLHKSCLLKNRLTSASANTATGQYPA